MAKEKSANREKIISLTVTAMLTALILVMSFTPIGYLRIGPLSLTLIMVPVIIGGVTRGPAVSAFLGLVFGATSFAQCFMGDVLGGILVNTSIVKAFIVCVGARVLTGYLCGLIYKLCAAHMKKPAGPLLIASISGSLLNTVLFLGLLALLFFGVQFTPDQSAALGGAQSVIAIVTATAAGINAPIELLVCALLGTAIGGAVRAALKKM